MVRRKRHVHRVLQQLGGAKARIRLLADTRELEQQGQVEFPGPQPRRDLLGLALGERQRYVGVTLPERRDRERH